MKLTFNKMAAACAVALSSGVAHANTLADFNASVQRVYSSGATATDNALEILSRAQTGGYCVAGTIHIYSATNQRVIFCETNGSRVAGFPAAPNTRIAFFKESEGGSSRGVVDLITTAQGGVHTLRWMDMATYAAATTNCTTAALSSSDTGITGLNNVSGRFTCTNTFITTPAPNLGISDTEPALSFPTPSATAVTNFLDVVPAVHISFGVPVTQKLYAALQQAQGKTVGDGANDVPSLTRSQLSGLFSGGVFDWNQITDLNGVGLAASPLVTDKPANTSIYVCRRVASSGTQATAEAYWLNQRCIAGSRTFVEPNDGSQVTDEVWVPANAGNGTVNAGPSSGNVRTCLNTYNTADVWGLGVLSNEVTSAQMVGFRMIAIDGAEPSLANTANGLYDYYSESVTVTIDQGDIGALDWADTNATDFRDELVAHIQANIGNAATLAQVDAAFAGRPWGNGGSMAIPVSPATPNSSPASVAEMSSNPVNTSRKFGNNCNPAIQSDFTPVYQ